MRVYKMKPKKCNFMRRARSLAEREAGCPLDHCACGTHDFDNKEHECEEEQDTEIEDAECAAGWDPYP